MKKIPKQEKKITDAKQIHSNIKILACIRGKTHHAYPKLPVRS